MSPTVTFQNGTAVSWAHVNTSSSYYYELYVSDIPKEFPLEEVTLVVTGSNGQDEYDINVLVQLDNCAPYVATAPASFTLVRGTTANSTLDASGVFADYEGDAITITANTTHTDTLDCVEFDGTDTFTIIPNTADGD